MCWHQFNQWAKALNVFIKILDMDNLLSADRQTYSDLLHQTKKLATEMLNKQEQIAPGKRIEDIELKSLPEVGMGGKEVLNLFADRYADKIASSAGPRYFGFVTGGSTPASVAGDWLVSALDQNACGSNDSIAPQIERQTIHFFREMFGLHDAYFGSFVTGATMSNFVGLALGRQWVGEQSGVDFSTEGVGSLTVKVISATPHSSILKSMSMLGIGRNAIIKPQTLPGREAVDLEDLERVLREQNGPVIVVANAGTVNTVDFDDLEAIGQLKKRYNFWLHVDAAFGGFAALSDKFKHLTAGINHADSITVDAHKWLNVPYDAAMQFTRHKQIQLKVFQNSAAYLGDPEKSPDFFHYTPENSRRWRALPSWFALMAYGKEGHREIMERNCEVASALGQLISTSNQFTLLAPVRMNVVCFTLNGNQVSFEEIQRFLKAVADDGRVFFTPTVYKGTPAIRAAISNWQTERKDIELAFEVLTQVYAKLYHLAEV
jgi:glutamate/tyrosine decarboxylase-like PLP-dependent enzyme